MGILELLDDIHFSVETITADAPFFTLFTLRTVARSAWPDILPRNPAPIQQDRIIHAPFYIAKTIILFTPALQQKARKRSTKSKSQDTLDIYSETTNPEETPYNRYSGSKGEKEDNGNTKKSKGPAPPRNRGTFGNSTQHVYQRSCRRRHPHRQCRSAPQLLMA